MSEIRTNDIISETGLGPVGFSSGLTVGTAITCYAPTGIVSATKYYGDGSSLTNLPASGASLANGADNRVVTASSATALNGEENLTYDGTDLKLIGASGNSNPANIQLVARNSNNQDRPTAKIQAFCNASESWTSQLVFTTRDSNTDFNEALRITGDDPPNVKVTNGNLVIGTAGKGVDFSATANASTSGSTMTSELLDWYEEGTWTPSITFGGTSAFSGGSMGASLGSYTRIGRLVIANFDTVISNKGSSGGLVHLNGLPFSSGGGAYRGGTCLAFNTWMNTDQKCSRTRMYLGDSRTYLQLLWNSLDNLNASDCNTSGQICGVITYQVP